MNCSVGPDLMLASSQDLQRGKRPTHQCVAQRRVATRTRWRRDILPASTGRLADWLDRFVTEFGVSIVGGCCGTTAEHLKTVIERLAGKKPAARSPKVVPAVSSLFSRSRVAPGTAAAPGRRADEHQRLAEVQATSRKGRLARARRDGQGAGARGRSCSRCVRGLRRPRRRPRHEGGHQAVQRSAHQADHARLAPRCRSSRPG